MSFALMTLLNVPFLLLHGTMAGLVGVWAALALGSAWWAGRRAWAWPSWGWLGLAALAVALSRAGAWLGGEEEIEIIITRKLLEGGGFHLDRLNYLEGLAPTYLLTPLYLFRAFLSYVSGLDPVLVHYRLGFLGPILGLLAVAALIAEIRRSRAEGLAFLIVGAVALALMPVGSRVPPLLFAGEGLVFFRGVFTVQVLHPLWALFTFRALRTGAPWEAGVSAALLAATLFVHGLDALYCLLGLPLVFLGSGRRKTFVGLGLAAMGTILAFRAAYAWYHPGEGALSAEQSRLVVEAMARMDLLALPEPISNWSYLRDRGVSFDLVDRFFLARLGPVLALAMLCVPGLLLALRPGWRAWAAGMPILAVLILRLPFLLLPALALNASLFPNLVYFVALPLLVTLWTAAVSLGGWLVGRRGRLGLAAALAMGLLVPRAAREIAWWSVAHRDAALSLFLLACLAGFLLRGRVPSRPARGAALAAAGLLLVPLLVSTSSAPLGSLLRAGATAPTPPPGYEAYVERMTSRLPRGLYEVLRYVRAQVPRGQVFAADPDVIRTIPLVADQYIVHSGVPFDFVEPYFARYGGEHPPFERVVRDFRVDYVVTRSPVRDLGRPLFEREGWRLYRVTRNSAPAQR